MRQFTVIAALLFAASASHAAPKAEHVQECKSIDAQIKQLEAEGRQAMSAGRQEQLRATTKRVRDRQFEIKC